MRVSIITGVSRGLGAALCTRLVAAGDQVVGLGRRAREVDGPAAAGGRFRLRETDLRQPATFPGRDECGAMIDGADHAVLIHNAAVVDPVDAVGKLPPSAVEEAVTVNLTAPMLLTNAFLAAVADTLPQHTRVTVLFVSSGAAHRTIEGWSVYGATKRGGEAFVEAVEAQFADQPHRTARIIQPGVMDTDMQARLREAAAGDAWFPTGEHFVQLHTRGELPDPDAVAAGIIDEHLGPVPT